MSPELALISNKVTADTPILGITKAGEWVRNKHGEVYMAIAPYSTTHVKAWQRSTGGDSAYVHINEWVKCEKIEPPEDVYAPF